MIVDAVTAGGNQARYQCRDGTNDADIVRAVVGGDEYRLAGRQLAGVAIDVGAHIGSVTVALALDHPDVTVVAVEPVPENFELLCANVQLNGIADGRVVALCRAAGCTGESTVTYGFPGAHRYIGNEQDSADAATELLVRTLSLHRLLELGGQREAAFLKIDCEGCEWELLADAAVARVREIVGEVHRGDGPDEFDRIEALLDATHDVTVDRARYLFDGVRR